MPLETDVEEFVRRVDTIVSDTQIETRPGTGIIEETVDFPPGEFVIERGRLGIQTRNTKTTSLPCSVPEMVCDSIQAQKIKCGCYIGLSDGSMAWTDQISNGCTGLITNLTPASPKQRWRQVDVTVIGCAGDDPAVTGAITFTYKYDKDCNFTKTSCSGGLEIVKPSSCFFGGSAQPIGPLDCDDPRVDQLVNDPCSGMPDGFPTFCTIHSATLSDEYDNASLKQDTRAALPPYSEKYDCSNEPPFQPGQNCLCTAQTYLSDDDPHFTGAPFGPPPRYFMRRFKYKFVFPNGEFAQKCQVLEWDDAFTPDNGGPVEGTHHSFVCEGGETEIGPFECFERDTNGTATITNFETFCQLPCPDMSCPPCA